MFRDDKQIAACCKVLLDRVLLGYVFGPDGPTPRGLAVIHGVLKNGSVLSSGEQLMIRIALDFWNGDGKATVAEILRTLDNGNTAAIASLLKASVNGSQEIDRWLRTFKGQTTSVRTVSGLRRESAAQERDEVDFACPRMQSDPPEDR